MTRAEIENVQVGDSVAASGWGWEYPVLEVGRLNPWGRQVRISSDIQGLLWVELLNGGREVLGKRHVD